MSSLINIVVLPLLWLVFGWRITLGIVLVKIVFTKVEPLLGAFCTLINAFLLVYCVNAFWHEPIYNITAIFAILICVYEDINETRRMETKNF